MLVEVSEASEANPLVDLEWIIMEAWMVSIRSSSSRIWCRMTILSSSWDTFWDIRRQPSQAECEVGDVIIMVGSGERRQLWPVKVILMIGKSWRLVLTLGVRLIACERHVPARATYSGPQRLVGKIAVFGRDDKQS